MWLVARCHVMPSGVMWCHIISCRVVSFHVMCDVVSFHVMCEPMECKMW